MRVACGCRIALPRQLKVEAAMPSVTRPLVVWRPDALGAPRRWRGATIVDLRRSMLISRCQGSIDATTSATHCVVCCRCEVHDFRAPVAVGGRVSIRSGAA